MPLPGGKPAVPDQQFGKPRVMSGVSPTAKSACSLHSNLHLQSLQDHNAGPAGAVLTALGTSNSQLSELLQGLKCRRSKNQALGARDDICLLLRKPQDDSSWFSGEHVRPSELQRGTLPGNQVEVVNSRNGNEENLFSLRIS